MTLYIYRVGKTYPARNPVYRSKSIKNSNYSRTPRPVRPVGPTGQIGRASAGSATAPERSDRMVRPVDANFDCQQGGCVPKWSFPELYYYFFFAKNKSISLQGAADIVDLQEILHLPISAEAFS